MLFIFFYFLFFLYIRNFIYYCVIICFVIFGKCGEAAFENSKKEKYGMARALTSKPLPNDIYIGITLD